MPPPAAQCRPVFTVRLEATRPGAIRRLRWLLKTLSRAHGFRCLWAEEDRGRQ
jgi:hypothetical protein